KRDYLRTVSLCFDIWKNYRATEPFPGIGFQTTNEPRPPDDLPCSEVKQSNPISTHYRLDCAKHKRLFHSDFFSPPISATPSTDLGLAKMAQRPLSRCNGRRLES